MRISRNLIPVLALMLALADTTGAFAQDGTPGGEPEATPPPADQSWQQAPAETGAEPADQSWQQTPAEASGQPAEPGAMPLAEPPDGPRFRGGVAFTLGGEFVNSVDFHALMFGVDGRLGVQLNDLVGLYVQPHLSFGSGGNGFASGATATFAAIAMVDFTFFDALFVGAGVGYGVFNNPSGAALGFRVGGYPVKTVSEDHPRRKGLMLSFDLRTVFLGGGYGTGIQTMVAVGYEAF